MGLVCRLDLPQTGVRTPDDVSFCFFPLANSLWSSYIYSYRRRCQSLAKCGATTHFGVDLFLLFLSLSARELSWQGLGETLNKLFWCTVLWARKAFQEAKYCKSVTEHRNWLSLWNRATNSISVSSDDSILRALKWLDWFEGAQCWKVQLLFWISFC